MVDIAQAADVAEQTVYNYFPTKEHLVFDMDTEFEARMVGVIENRVPGVSIAQSLRSAAIEFLKEVCRSTRKKMTLPTSVVMGPALRRVWVEMNSRHADSLANALIVDSDGKMHKATAKILARCIVATFAVILEEAGVGTMAGQSARVLLRDLRPAIESAVDQLEWGLGPLSARQ